MKREEKKQLTRMGILKIARQSFIQNGIKATEIRDIARKANVSTVTLYKYFPSKDDLATAAVILQMDEIADKIMLQLEDSSEDFFTALQKVQDLIEASISTISSDEFLEFLNISYFSNAEVIAEQDAIIQRIGTLIFQRLQAANLVRPDVSLEAFLINVDMIVQYSRLPKNQGKFGPQISHEAKPQPSELEKSLLSLLLFGISGVKPTGTPEFLI